MGVKRKILHIILLEVERLLCIIFGVIIILFYLHIEE